jgi:hypothetical protein
VDAESRAFVAKWVPAIKPKKVLEVGSYDENGNIRDLFAGCEYLGQDLRPGRNVDTTESVIEIAATRGGFDLVVCLNVLEHCRNPLTLMLYMVQCLWLGGHILVDVPLEIAVHRHPIDCWRILPDGMRVLADDAGLEVVEIGNLPTGHKHTYLVGRRG